ncbi:MAG: type II secretion system minor pseudopilin GspI [Gammaproteobacteria bacterium]|nr:type II secretion system minor pseudopilin GspI [Gammaproteobacteria bacterium]
MLRNKQKGLTLLELLIAMSITGILIVPLVYGLFNSSAQSISANRDKTLASYVAKNYIAELQLADNWPSVGTKDSEMELANREWKIKHQVVETSEPKMRRVTVTVAYGGDGTFTMTGFVGQKDNKQ